MERKTITKLPTNWPTDKLTKRTDNDGRIIIAHPDRVTHISDDGRTWEEIKYVDHPQESMVAAAC